MALITFNVDSFLTGGRGSPNAISPGSDGASWTQQRGTQIASYAANQGVFANNGDTFLGVWTYGSTSQTDQEVLVNVVQGTANTEIVGAVVRCSDSTHLYYADIGNSSGNIEIGKRAGGSFTPLITAPFASSFGTKYSIRFQAVGSVLKAKIWDASTSEPTAWSIQWTDTSLNAGFSGICMAPVGSSTCKFDTFSSTNGATPATNPVDPAYGAEQLGLVAGAVNADLAPGQDINPYEVWSLQIDAIASGATVTFQGCNDGINYVSIPAYNAAGTLVQTTTTTGLFWGPRMYRYFRARQTAWTSGLTTGTLELYKSAAAFVFAQTLAATQSGTWTVQPGNTANTTAWKVDGSAVTQPVSGTVVASRYPTGATILTGDSGNIANASAVATLSSSSGKTAWITGFEITGSGSTSGGPVTVTVAGLTGGTMHFTYTAAIGVLLPNQPLIIEFPDEISASATNTDIVVTCPALGTGNTNNTVVAHGYKV